METIRLKAKYILASPQILLQAGQLVIGGGRILEVSSRCNEEPDVDLGETVILPGLINAHTHLEFSDLQQPFPAGENFPAWIGRVISHRRRQENELGEAGWRLQRRKTLAAGIGEARRTGTAFLADIVNLPWSIDDLPSTLFSESDSGGGDDDREEAWPEFRPRIFALPEIIGLTLERLESTMAWALDTSQQASEFSPLEFGLSPHAPYSVIWNHLQHLYERIDEPAITAMHVAESLDEMEYLASGGGAFKESLEALGIPVPRSRPSVEEVIRFLAGRKRSLLVHGNYLSDSQIEQLAQANQLSVVYCPRTHQYFNHPTYPLSSFKRHGVRVVLGTDSRASNPDLNLWSELVAARRRHPEFSPEAALAAVTQDAATALGIEEDLGAIAVGKLALLNAVPCQPEWTTLNLLEELTQNEVRLRPLGSSWGN